MPNTVLIKNASILKTQSSGQSPEDVFETVSVLIKGERIDSVQSSPEGLTADQEIDADGFWLLPGIIDLNFHLTEPGNTQKGTIFSESKAALAGGVTHIACPPVTQPCTDSSAVVQFIQDRAVEANYPNVLPIGALTQGLDGSKLANLKGLTDAGAIAFSNYRSPMQDSITLKRCLQYAATYDLTVFFYPENTSLKGNGCVHEGQYSTLTGLSGISESTETTALAEQLLLVEEVGVRAHFSELSTAKSVEMIEQAKAKGLNITADTSISQLIFTEEVIEGFDSMYHVNPPYRTEKDRAALIDGLKSGVIDVIASAHQPHEEAAKAAPFSDTAPGISSVETFVLNALDVAKQNDIPLNTILNALTAAPASIAKVKNHNIQPGSFANLALIKPETTCIKEVSSWLSKGCNSPFIDKSYNNALLYTILNGEIAYQGQK